ncbi:MAG: hypothetical protein R2911_38245 [Caldilineaceae bacterium]
MRGRGMGRAPIFRGPPVVRGPVIRRTSGFLGVLGWLFPGLVGFWLGKNYSETERTMAEREADLQRREAAVRQREQTFMEDR